MIPWSEDDPELGPEPKERQMAVSTKCSLVTASTRDQDAAARARNQGLSGMGTKYLLHYPFLSGTGSIILSFKIPLALTVLERNG